MFGNKRNNAYICPESEDIMLDRLIIHIMLLLFLAPTVGKSQSVNKAELNHSRPMLNVSTNLLYDVVLAPSVRVETGIGNQLSIAVSGTYGWNEGWPWYENIRVVTADTEVRYWINHKGAEMMRRGLHIGIYGAVYRYDFLFGGKGQEAKANWGTGLTCGYSLPVSSDFSFDFNVGLGYVGGKYQEYEPIDDSYHHNVWTADKVRHYMGPTKVEVAFVWHIGRVGK